MADADSGDGYAIHPRSEAHRYKKLVVYDYETVHSILNEAPFLHVSFPPGGDDPFPATLPMIGVCGKFGAETDPAPLNTPLDCYVHGHVASRLAKCGTAAESASTGVDDEVGLPVTLSAAELHGLVLSLTPFSHNLNYKSAVAHGWATLVQDDAEKSFAMRAITNKILASRWEDTRPPTSAEIKSTAILRVRIVSASAKIRQGGPSDERKDKRNDELLASVWTGVLPVSRAVGTPVPSSYNQVAKYPANVVTALEESKAREGASAEYAQVEPK